MTSNKDNIFNNKIDHIKEFEFNSDVANVFDDMINRSVPGYRTVVGITGIIAEHFYQDHSVCYDLGCSLGATTLAMAQRIPNQGKIIGVDNSQAMIERCRENIEKVNPPQEITLCCDDILNIEINSASVVTLNYTLQFIAQEKRLSLLQDIYRGMLPGGPGHHLGLPPAYSRVCPYPRDLRLGGNRADPGVRLAGGRLSQADAAATRARRHCGTACHPSCR